MVEIDVISLDNKSRPEPPRKFRHLFISKCHNNAHNGRAGFGGELYERCLIIVNNNFINTRDITVTIKYFYPNGKPDKDLYDLEFYYQLTDLDCLRIMEEGSTRDYMKMLFRISDKMEEEDDIPLRKRYADIAKRRV